jgi:thymidylate synthase
MINGNTYYGEAGYLLMMKDVLQNGVDVPDRTGVGSRAMFDAKVIYQPGEFPFSTVRPAGLKLAYEEFWSMMLQGITQTKVLEEKGIYFWQGNTTREFLDSRGLTDLEEGDMGQAYGHQWRRFNDELAHSARDVVDQLEQTVDTLKKDIYSRRLYTTLWNPSASQYMALTPCWHSHQFVALPDETGEPVLHLKLFNRSLDSVFGFQFAVQQYKLYQMAIAQLVGVKCGALICDLSQVHIYQNQMAYAKELLTRDLGTPGEVRIEKALNTLDDLLSIKWEDIKIEGLIVNKDKFVTPRPEMAA